MLVCAAWCAPTGFSVVIFVAVHVTYSVLNQPVCSRGMHDVQFEN